MISLTSFVNAKQVFLQGQLQVNHLQYNMTLQTFKAQMAAGLWASTLLYPGLACVTKMVKMCMGESKDGILEDDIVDLDMKSI